MLLDLIIIVDILGKATSKIRKLVHVFLYSFFKLNLVEDLNHFSVDGKPKLSSMHS